MYPRPFTTEWSLANDKYFTARDSVVSMNQTVFGLAIKRRPRYVPCVNGCYSYSVHFPVYVSIRLSVMCYFLRLISLTHEDLMFTTVCDCITASDVMALRRRYINVGVLFILLFNQNINVYNAPSMKLCSNNHT